jgi:hypothetical protein
MQKKKERLAGDGVSVASEAGARSRTAAPSLHVRIVVYATERDTDKCSQTLTKTARHAP